MKSNKRPYEDAVWHTRLDFDRKYQAVSVSGDQLIIAFMPGQKRDGFSLNISRKDARLLAKRINQCLDATAKK